MSVSNFFTSLDIKQPFFTKVFLVFCLALLVLISAFSPRFLAIGPSIIAILSMILMTVESGSYPKIQKGILIAMGMIAGMALVSSQWSLDPNFAIERSAKIALISLPSAVLLSLCFMIEGDGRKLLTIFLPIFTLFAGLICVINLYYDGLIYFLSHERKDPTGYFNLSNLNRSVNVFTLMCLPSFYLLYRASYNRWVRCVFAAILFFVLCLVLYRTDSQSAQAAFGFAVLMGLLFPVRSRKMWYVFGLAIVSAMALAPWIAQILYMYLAEHMGNLGQWFRDSYMADRMEIWDYISRKALDNTIYGFGVEATRHIDQFDTKMLYTPTDHVLHPHNAVLQVWIEYGAIGISAFSGFIGMILRYIRHLPYHYDRRFVLAMFMAVFFMANTSYGLWQGWWLGLMSCIAAISVIICRTSVREEAG